METLTHHAIRLAIALYQKGFLVIKAAPATWRQLLNDLRVIRNIIFRTHLKLTQGFYSAEYDDILSALEVCRDSLLLFQPLVKKYQKLGSSNLSAKWTRLCSPFDEKKIAECKQSLRDAKATLNLALSSRVALDLHPAVKQPAPGGSVDIILDPATFPGRLSGVSGKTNAGLIDGQQNLTGALSELGIERVRTIDTQDELVISAGDIDASQLSGSRRRNPVRFGSSSSNADDVRAQRHRPGESDASTVSSQSARNPPSASQLHSVQSSDVSLTSQSQASGHSAGLVSRPVQDRSLYSVNYADYEDQDSDFPGLDNIHQDDILSKLQSDTRFQDLGEVFSQRAQLMSHIKPLTEWLSCALWWLLKSRAVLEALSDQNRVNRLGTATWPVTVSTKQAAVDQLKACWILENKVLVSDNEDAKITGAAWKMFSDVCDAIHGDLFERDTLGKFLADVNAVKNRNTLLEEHLSQAVEQVSAVPEAIDSLDPPSRWFTLYQDEAGSTNERVFLRTFVNAAIGDQPRRTKEAPYMLILWSVQGRSEVLISLVNQCGTVNLTAPITREHLRHYDEHSVESDLEFKISFPSQEHVTIRFLSSTDLDKVLGIPRTYYEHLQEWEPADGELLVFRESIRAFNQYQTGSANLDGPVGRGMSQERIVCELSLYVGIPSESWKTQRRLFVTSALGSKKPWCQSFWLPLGDVKVLRNGLDMTITFSDCCQSAKRPDGQFGWYYSFVYDENKPNHNMRIQFDTDQAADEFYSAILRPWDLPCRLGNISLIKCYQHDHGSERTVPNGKEIAVWKMEDREDHEASRYLSLVLTNKTLNGSISSKVYFLLRDVDFIIGQADTTSVEFPALYVPHYLSNINGFRRRPSREETPKYEGAEWKRAKETFHFSSETGLRLFMHDITSWQVIVTCLATSLQISHGLRSTSKRRDVAVTLWANPAKSSLHTGGEHRLTFRCLEPSNRSDDPLWITIDLPPDCDHSNNARNRQVILKHAGVCLGEELDITSLRAVQDQHATRARTDRQVVVTFADVTTMERLSHGLFHCLHGQRRLPFPDISVPFQHDRYL